MDANILLRNLEEKNVKFLNVCVVDMLGNPRCMMLTIKNLDADSLEFGIGFDGSSIIGYSEINKSDLIAKPDLDTLVIENDTSIAYILSNVYTPEEKPFDCDPRNIAKRFLEKLEGKGLKAFVAPELEFFLFEKFSPKGILIDAVSGSYRFEFESPETKMETGYHIGSKKGYFSIPPHDKTIQYRKILTDKLEEIGVPLTKSHHEVASMSQIEMNLKHADPYTSANNLLYLKMYAKIVAEKMGLRATFMPKPIYGDNGSGLHTHLSVWDNQGRNLFYDEKDDYAQISDFAKYFIGGILHHAKALSAVVAPTVNSYKRLVMGFEAPTFISWGKSNRSALIRIPYYKGKDAGGKRIEVRFPDPSSNPYLVFTTIIASGLDGVDKNIDPGDPVDEDLYSIGKDSNFDSLPRDLWEALDHFEKSDLMKETLGECFVDKYLQYKRSEFVEFANQITLWEYLKYLYA